MARWRLTAAHYLRVAGTEWEYKETDRNTGKQVRRTFEVPAYLNPDDQSDCNYPGDIIVADRPSREYPRDIIFVGKPTPDMEPLDDEAQAISDQTRHEWVHPIESLPGQGYSQSLILDMEKAMTTMLANSKTSIPENRAVDPSAFAALQEQVAALMARNAELEAAQPPASARRA